MLSLLLHPSARASTAALWRLVSVAPLHRQTGAAAATVLLPLTCLRAYSASLNGNRAPLDIGRNGNPMFSHPDSRSSTSQAAFELRVPGVVLAMEPSVPHPGSADVPNPSAKLLEKVPIAKVTVDGDVTAGSMPEPPGNSQPRN